MLAEERLRTGDLSGALEDLQARVRKAPGDAKLRIFLFQLLTVLGQWDRALTQLKVAGDLDPANLPMVQTYREALRCEVLRAQIFAGKKTPVVFGEPEEWVALLIESLRLTGEGDAPGAEALRNQAFDAAPTTSGTVNGEAFEWIADGDSRLGPMLEAIVNGRFYFVPFHRIRSLTIEAPADLRDFVWMPAIVSLTTGAETVALIPTRYPGTEASDDANLKLAKRTEWVSSMGGYLGLGQRTWVTDTGEVSLLDVRQLELASPDMEVDAEASDADATAGEAASG